MRAVARKIATLREKAGMSQTQLAAKLNVTAQWVQHLEQKGSNMTLHSIAKLANALGVRPADLLDVELD